MILAGGPAGLVACPEANCASLRAATPARLALLVSADVPDDVDVRTSEALTCANAIDDGRHSDTKVHVFAANGACMHAWDGLLRDATTAMLGGKIARLVQSEPCHDLARAWRTAFGVLEEGSQAVFAIRLSQSPLDTTTGRCAGPTDPLLDYPWGEAKRRSIRGILLVRDAAEKKRVEEAARDHDAGALIVACARGEDCCGWIQSWPPDTAWLTWLSEVGREAVAGHELAKVLTFFVTLVMAITAAAWAWIRRTRSS